MSVFSCHHSKVILVLLVMLMTIGSYARAKEPAPAPEAPPMQETTAVQATEEEAQPEEENTAPETIMHIDHMLALQYGPLGALYEIDPYFRWDFFPGTDNILLRDAHFAAGLTVVLTPSVAWWGPSITIAPLTIFNLNVQFTHVIYGVGGPTFGLMDYNEPDQNSSLSDLHLGQKGNYNYAYRTENADELGEFSADIWSVFIKPSVFLQFGPIVFAYLGNYMYFHPTKHQGLYYNDFMDIILSHKSWCLMNDMFLLYEIASLEKKSYGIYLGIQNQLTFVIDDDAYVEDAYRWKIGPMLAWTFTKQLWDYAVEEPTLIVQLQYIGHEPIREENTRYFSAIVALAFSTDWQKKLGN